MFVFVWDILKVLKISRSDKFSSTLSFTNPLAAMLQSSKYFQSFSFVFPRNLFTTFISARVLLWQVKSIKKCFLFLNFFFHLADDHHPTSFFYFKIFSFIFIGHKKNFFGFSHFSRLCDKSVENFEFLH